MCILYIPTSQAEEKKKEVKTNITKKVDTPYSHLLLFVRVIEIVREAYVDKKAVSYNRLIQGALRGMLHELDPFSSYNTPSETKKFKSLISGTAGGIGVVVNLKNSILRVIVAHKNQPAYKAGIRSGDIITEIDGKSTRQMNFHNCIVAIKGEIGSDVDLTVYRKSEDKYYEFTVTRALIKFSPVRGTKIITPEIGYIKITQFTAPLTNDLDSALKELNKKNIKGLIIDLRDNPGGLFRGAVEFCSRFLETGKEIVFTEGRTRDTRKYFKSLPCKIKLLNLPLVILMNGNTASSSEIVSGCLQNHKRAVLVGEQSFGKGVVQSMINLKKYGTLRITTSRYFTPNGKCIHKIGLKPDIHIPLSERASFLIAKQSQFYPGVVKPNIRNAIYDRQLARAIELMKAIVIFKKVKK
jgi:carboxyl-terminal processing protease